jgi:hypothetical protein
VNEIKTINILSPGDHSVGIPDFRLELKDHACELIADMMVFAEEDRKEVVEEFREKLQEAFAVVCDSPIYVYFNDERIVEY